MPENTMPEYKDTLTWTATLLLEANAEDRPSCLISEKDAAAHMLRWNINPAWGLEREVVTCGRWRLRRVEPKAVAA